jgi:hypothetical protein
MGRIVSIVYENSVGHYRAEVREIARAQFEVLFLTVRGKQNWMAVRRECFTSVSAAQQAARAWCKG